MRERMIWWNINCFSTSLAVQTKLPKYFGPKQTFWRKAIFDSTKIESNWTNRSTKWRSWVDFARYWLIVIFCFKKESILSWYYVKAVLFCFSTTASSMVNYLILYLNYSGLRYSKTLIMKKSIVVFSVSFRSDRRLRTELSDIVLFMMLLKH